MALTKENSMLKIGLSALIGISSGSMGYVGVKTFQLVKEREALRRIFQDISEIQYALINNRADSLALIPVLLDKENKFKKLQLRIQHNPMFKHLGFLGSTQSNDLKWFEEVMPSEMSIRTKHQLLAAPCGWNFADDVTMSMFLGSEIENPDKMLNRNSDFIKRIETISEKVLQLHMNEKEEIFFPKDFIVFSKHALKLQEESQGEIKKGILDTQYIDKCMFRYVQEYSDSSNTKSDIRERILEKKYELNLFDVSATNYAVKLKHNMDAIWYQMENNPSHLAKLKAKQLKNIAEWDVLLACIEGLCGVENALWTHKTILNLPHNRTKSKIESTVRE